MIHLSKVTKISAGKTALREATMLLPKGSYASLKVDTETTSIALLRLLMGYEKPDRGTVRINDIDITRLAETRVPFLRRNVGLLEYKPNLAGNRTVVENLAMPLQIAGFERKVMSERIADKLEQAGLEEQATAIVQRLDASTQRLLACARATIHHPQTILADNPDSGVSSEHRERIFKMIESANQGGSTVMLITGETPSRAFTHTLNAYKGALIQNQHQKQSQHHVRNQSLPKGMA